VLRALHETELRCGLVAVTGSDEGNLEAGRVGRDIGYDPVIAILHDPRSASLYREQRITALDRTHLLADHVERSLHLSGAVVPAGVGLGRGELVEIRVQRTSPVLHRPLKNLALQKWRIAAVFRGDELIVPTGETVLEEDDRVLLVGEPEVLATVTEYLRLGTPQFPRPYGPNVATMEFAGRDEELLAEARWLAQATGAAHVVRGAPEEAENPPPGDREELLTQPDHAIDLAPHGFRLPKLSDPELSFKVTAQRPGVVLLRPMRRTALARVIGLRGPDAELCDALLAPLWFARGTHPVRRILLPVSDSPLAMAAAEVAIDITRKLGAALSAINVDLPKAISGLSEDALHEEVVPVRQLCELYQVPLEYRHREGNPVRHIVEEAARHDLVVLARRRKRRDSYLDPDVALRVARQARCSVLVLTVGPEE
jgi:nucleotide-binding universal stress UspA family protein